MKTVICCGYLCCDIIAAVESYPEENNKQFIEKLTVSAGGPAANAACLLAEWGVRTYLYAQLGADHFSDPVIADLQRFGVLTDRIQRYAGPVNCAIAISNTQNGARTVLTKTSSRDYPLTTFPKWEPVDGLLLDGHQPEWSRYLLSLHDGISVLDAGSFRDETLALLGEVTDPIASHPFYLGLTKYLKHNSAPAARVSNTLVVTNGENPVQIVRNECISTIATFNVHAVDTLAAGDCFHGAYLFGRMHNLSIEDASILAAAASAICVTRHGGNHSLPSLNETIQFLHGQQTADARHVASQIESHII